MNFSTANIKFLILKYIKNGTLSPKQPSKIYTSMIRWVITEKLLAPTQKGAIFLQKCYKVEGHDFLKVKSTMC